MTHHLPSSHANGLDRELASTHIEEVLETGPEQIDNEDIVEAFLTKVVDLWDSGWNG